MFSKSTWLAPTALLIVCGIAFGATGFRLFVAAAAIALVFTVAALWKDFKPRDKYSLQSLKDFEERQELANLDPKVGTFEYDDYLCPYCRTLFSTEHRNCPQCGRVRARIG